MSSDYPVQSQPSKNPIPENAKEKQSRAKLLASDMLLDDERALIWAAILLLACLLTLPCVRVCLLACLFLRMQQTFSTKRRAPPLTSRGCCVII